MKIFKKFICCFSALAFSAILLYLDILSAFPAEITMYENEPHRREMGSFVSVGDLPESIAANTAEKTVVPLKTGEYGATLKIGDKIPFKKVKINVTQPHNVYVSGELIGLRIHNRGLIVTDISAVLSAGREISPAQSAGLMPGDILLEINGKEVHTAQEVAPLLTADTSVTFMRGNTLKKTVLTPVRDDKDSLPKLGVWVRDSTAGVGTMTFFDSESGFFGSLGHGISDSDTGIMFDVESGTMEKSKVVSVKKGERGEPGEICGSFSYEENVSGTVSKNTESGVFGIVFPKNNLSGKLFPIGVMSQVETGKAQILSTVDETIKAYEISILRTMPFGSAAKGLMIKITDPVLLEKTGGIIQGMSGSPIIQNGKLVGAVTHVCVNL